MSLRKNTGLKRIQELLQLAGSQPAIFNFEEDSHFFEIEIERPEKYRNLQQTKSKPILKTTQKILELIKANPDITRKELTEVLGHITEEGVKYQLNKLQKTGLIKRIGPEKGGHWQILGEKN